MIVNKDITKLVNYLTKFPGIGQRTASKMVLKLLTNKHDFMIPLGEALLDLAKHLNECENCHNIDSVMPCSICANDRRESDIICVVEGVSDLWAIESSGGFKGRYHVLGGALSAVDGVTPDKLNIMSLLERMRKEAIKELIIATNATPEGQITAFFIMDKMAEHAYQDIMVSRLAFGVPIGSELDHLDESTLMHAFSLRKPLI